MRIFRYMLMEVKVDMGEQEETVKRVIKVVMGGMQLNILLEQMVVMEVQEEMEVEVEMEGREVLVEISGLK